MLDIILEDRNRERHQRRLALGLLERQHDEAAAFLVKYEAGLHCAGAAWGNDSRGHLCLSLPVAAYRLRDARARRQGFLQTQALGNACPHLPNFGGRADVRGLGRINRPNPRQLVSGDSQRKCTELIVRS